MKKYSVRIGKNAAATLSSPESVALALLDGMNEKGFRATFTDLLDYLDITACDPLPPISALADILADEVGDLSTGEIVWAGDDCVERIQ